MRKFKNWTLKEYCDSPNKWNTKWKLLYRETPRDMNMSLVTIHLDSRLQLQYALKDAEQRAKKILRCLEK